MSGFYIKSLLVLCSLALVAQCLHVRSDSNCVPFSSSLNPSDVSGKDFSGNSPFVIVSPPGSAESSENGLELFLDKPSGTIQHKDNTNSKVAEGATVNSTFTIMHGKVTLELAGPAVAGVVTAAIMIAEQHDEIDVELAGGDPSHWQTNVFTQSPEDEEPLYGIFGQIEDYSRESSVDEFHKYTIDWNQDRIIWSVDGRPVRTLHREDTRHEGTLHYPSHPARIQLGIWDASYPAGTSEWARGPIDWNRAPRRMSARFKSVTVECPY